MIEVPGQPLAERILRAALADEHPPQQLLFHGPAGTGKRAAARDTAWEMMDPAGRHERTGTALDLSEVRAAGATILLADLDAAVAQINYHPSVMERRVLIIEGAERLRAHEGAARVLKVLEEPPPRAVLLLVCSAAGRLMPTIRSRCRRLNLAPLGEDLVRTLLGRYAPEVAAEDAARIAMIAEGSIGRALALAAGGGVALSGLVDDVLAAVPNVGAARAHAVADALGRDDDAFGTFMSLLAAGIAAAVRDAARGRADPDQARLLGDRPLAAWVDVWHGLNRLRDETEGAYLDKRQAIVAGLAMLAGGAPKVS